MKTAKLFPLVCLVLLLLVSVTIAQEKKDQTTMPVPTTAYQAKLPITIQAGEYDLVSVILDFPPGTGLPDHMHGGHVLVTVLSGEITLREKSTERIIKAGGSWMEDPGDVHAVVNAGGTIARVAVAILLPKGAETTTIIKK